MITDLSIDLIPHLSDREIAACLGVPSDPHLMVNTASTDTRWLHLRTCDGEAVAWEVTWTGVDPDGETRLETETGTLADLGEKLTHILGHADRIPTPAHPVYLEISRWALHYLLSTDTEKWARKAFTS
ncbi:hypothetical protein ACIBCN_18935 [Nocardia sp. NPDC051052]|uniref:hypothetical protein n=1 Tax=Nocardia sp. NPDC051052 TaxID=3364322 RepID=UPI0037B164AC